MRTLAKWLFRLLIVLLAVAVLVPVAATLFVKQDEVKSRLAGWFMQQTGREFSIKGDIGFEPGLEIRVYANDVTLQNPPWATRPDAISATRIEATMALLPFLSGRVEIDSLQLIGASIWSEFDSAQGSNLRLTRGRRVAGSEPNPVPAWFGISKIEFVDSKIEFGSASGKRTTKIAIDEGFLQSRSRQLPVQIDATGSINGLPVVLSGQASTLGTVLARQPTQMTLLLESTTGDRLEASGVVQDVIGWDNIDAALNYQIKSLPNLTPLFNRPPVLIEQISGTARLKQPDGFSSGAVQEVSASFRYGALEFQGTGEIGRLSRLEKYDLDIAASSDALELSSLPGLQQTAAQWPSPIIHLVAHVTGSNRALNVEIENFEALLGENKLYATGGFVWTAGQWSKPLNLSLNVPDMTSFGEMFDWKFPGVGIMDATADLRRSAEGYEITALAFGNQGGAVDLSGSGKIEKLNNIPFAGQLEFDIDADTEFFTQDYFNLPIEQVTVAGKGSLTFADRLGELTLQSTNLEFPGGQLSTEGNSFNLPFDSNSSLDISGNVTDWGALSTVVNIPLPDTDPLNGTATLTGNEDGTINLENIALSVTGDSGVSVITGRIDSLGEKASGNFGFVIDSTMSELQKAIPALSSLEKYTPPDSSITAEGQLILASGKALSVPRFSAQLQAAGIPAEVRGSAITLTPAVAGTLEVKARGRLDAGLEAIPQIPHQSEIDLSFELALGQQKSQVSFVVGEIQSAVVNARISAEQLALGDELSGKINIDLSSSDASKLFPAVKSIREYVPLNAKLVLLATPKRWVTSGTILSGESDFEGDIVFDSSGGIPRIEVKGSSKVLDVDALLIPPASEKRFFSEQPIFPQWMKVREGEIDLKVGQFRNNAVDLDNMAAIIRYDTNGQFVRLSAARGVGTLSGNLEFKTGSSSRLRFKTHEMPITAFRGLIRKNIFQGGHLNMNIEVDGSGESLSDVLRKGNGAIEIALNKSSIKSAALDTVGGDLAYNILRQLNPFVKRNELVNVECGVIVLDITDGKAVTRNGLAMKTDRVTLLGGGELRLGNESLRIEIAPKARRGFGISASSLAKMIRIGGTLSDPDVEASATGFFKSGAAIGAAIVSGGLSLLGQGLLDRLTANANVCSIARGEGIEKPVINDDTLTR